MVVCGEDELQHVGSEGFDEASSSTGGMDHEMMEAGARGDTLEAMECPVDEQDGAVSSSGACGSLVVEENLSHYYLQTNCPNDTDYYQKALVEAIALEAKYQPSTYMPPIPKDNLEISARMRNGSCHVLRCLKVWYDLPSDVFFFAVNSIDRFLTRMRAQPKHLSCIAVAAFSVAAQEVCPMIGRTAPSRESISVISQSKCTPNDVLRMEDIIRKKLGLTPLPSQDASGKPPMRRGGLPAHLPITAIHFMKLVYKLFEFLLRYHGVPGAPSADELPPLLTMIHKLEVVLCDARCSNYRPSEIAISLLWTQICRTDSKYGAFFSNLMQPIINVCRVKRLVLARIEEVLFSVLKDYDTPIRAKDACPQHVYYRQRLVWKLSNRTYRQLRPTSKLKQHMILPVVWESDDEHILSAPRHRSTIGLGVVEETIEGAALQSQVQAITAHMTEEEECMDTNEENKRDEAMEAEEQQVLMKVEAMKAIDDKAAYGDHGGEESYCQVAKKMRQEKKERLSPTTDLAKRAPMFPSFNTSPTYNSVQRSPLSKITLTSSLHSSSPAVKNLSRVLIDDSEPEAPYGYPHHARLVGVLETLDGNITAAQLKMAAADGKRKKRRVRLGIFTQIRYDSDSDMNSDHASSSSEEEMDSDYEKEFPPLPLPRILHIRLGKKMPTSIPSGLASTYVVTSTSAIVKKKKKSDAGVAPYPNKSKARRKMQRTRKMGSAVVVQQK